MHDNEAQSSQTLWGIPLTPLMEIEAMQQQWLIDHLIPAQGMTLISGQPESGKTTLAVTLADSIITGHPLAGDSRFAVHPPRNGQPHHKVMWLGTDSGWLDELSRNVERHGLLREQSGQLTTGKGMEARLRFDSADVPTVMDHWKQFRDYLVSMGVTVLVVDHLYAMAGAVNVNYANEVSPLLSALGMVESAGIAVLLLHHATTHGTSGEPMGSTAIVAHRRCGLEVTTSGKTLITTVTVRANEAPTMKLRLRLVESRPVEVLGFKPQVGSVSGATSDVTEMKPKANRSQSSIDLARAILAAPDAARKNPTTAGRFLVNEGLICEGADGRSRVNRLIGKEFLVRDGEGGPLVAGPKWGGQQQAA